MKEPYACSPHRRSEGDLTRVVKHACFLSVNSCCRGSRTREAAIAHVMTWGIDLSDLLERV